MTAVTASDDDGLLALEVSSCCVLTRVTEATLERVLVLEDRDVGFPTVAGSHHDELRLENAFGLIGTDNRYRPGVGGIVIRSGLDRALHPNVQLHRLRLERFILAMLRGFKDKRTHICLEPIGQLVFGCTDMITMVRKADTTHTSVA